MSSKDEDVRASKIAQGKKALEQLRLLKNKNTNGSEIGSEKLVVLPSPFMSRVSRPRERPRSLPSDRIGARAHLNSELSQWAKTVPAELKQSTKTALSDCTNTPVSFNDPSAEEIVGPEPIVPAISLNEIEKSSSPQVEAVPPLPTSHPSVPIRVEPPENSDQAPAADAVNPPAQLHNFA